MSLSVSYIALLIGAYFLGQLRLGFRPCETWLDSEECKDSFAVYFSGQGKVKQTLSVYCQTLQQEKVSFQALLTENLIYLQTPY